jgi:hypothetical protein
MFYFKSNKAMTNDDLPTYFIVNEKRLLDQSAIFGIRELNFTEFEMYSIRRYSYYTYIPYSKEKVNQKLKFI